MKQHQLFNHIFNAGAPAPSQSIIFIQIEPLHSVDVPKLTPGYGFDKFYLVHS